MFMVRDAMIGREILSRCNLYTQRSLEGFFADPAKLQLWAIGAAWAEWEERGLSAAKRVKELAKA